MFDALRNWLRLSQSQRALKRSTQTRHRRAIEKVAQHFTHETERNPIGCVVIADTPEYLIVRVMYVDSHVPPERAWYRVQLNGSIEELPFDAVAELETSAWR